MSQRWSVVEGEHEHYSDQVLEMLTNNFMGKQNVHCDVRGSIIGTFLKGGAVPISVYDLHSVVD